MLAVDNPHHFYEESMSLGTQIFSSDSINQLAPAEVSLTNVSKAFGSGPERVDVLHNVNVTASPGEILAILGPSGCGKSTLLRLVAGLETATSGSVCVDGHLVTGIDAQVQIWYAQ